MLLRLCVFCGHVERLAQLKCSDSKPSVLLMASQGLSQGEMKPSGTLRGSWAKKPFCVPHFLCVGNRVHSAPMTFPEFQLVELKQLLIREGRGCRDQGGATKKQ